MTVSRQILLLLSQKKELFLELEEVTSNICLLPMEELSAQTDKRGALLERLEKLDNEIRTLCKGDKEMLAALNHTCQREGLAPELAGLFDASLSVKSVINRIMKNEENIRMHLTMEKQRIADQVEALTHSGSAVADRYHQSVKTGMNPPLGMGSNKII